jgi:hypothetical protein
MPTPASHFFDALQRRFIRLEQTSTRIGKLHSEGKISAFDVEQIYAGLFLDAFVSLERFIEDLFLGYVSGLITCPSTSSHPLFQIKPSAKAKEVMLAGKNYIDWLPYESNTKKRAEVFFNKHSPFVTLTKPEEQLLIQLHQIRNALAHRSAHSLDVFKRLVIGNLPISPRDKKPSRFLLTIFRSNPSQTRLQNYLFEMLTIAKHLSA